MLIGIVGLPNSSKTTVFNALTRGQVETAAFSVTQFTVHRAVVDVPDPRVDRLSAMFNPKKTIYARVEYKDIGGLAKGISEGGLSGELLGAIAQTEALLHVVRAFDDDDVPHPEVTIDPARDVAILDAEFLLSDLVIVEKRLERLADQLRRPGGSGPERLANEAEQVLLQRLHSELEAETPVRDLDLTAEEAKTIRGFQLLTAKPLLIVLNTGDADVADPATLLTYRHRQSAVATIRGRLEAELAILDESERALFMDAYDITEPGLNRVIRLSYDLLGLQSFFTVGEDEVRAWTIPVGATAVDAAGTIHTDLARGFIRAEVAAYDDLIAAGGMVEAKKVGKVRLEGRDYIMHDGDVVNIRFNV
jgi:GTP-binding protein YchF